MQSSILVQCCKDLGGHTFITGHEKIITLLKGIYILILLIKLGRDFIFTYLFEDTDQIEKALSDNLIWKEHEKLCSIGTNLLENGYGKDSYK